MRIEIEGKKYTVTEKLGFNPDVGHYCYFVDCDGVEKMVVKISKNTFRFWTIKNRFGLN